MIEIICQKCNRKTTNQFYFGHKHYSYIDENNGLRSDIHLCKDCQLELEQLQMVTVANFLGVKCVRDWKEQKGLL